MKSVYTICYFSKASEDLSEEEIQEIFDHTNERNNERGVRGILLHSFGNFFQVLEGDEEYLTNLYTTKIKHDTRHHSVFEVINKESTKSLFEEYNSRFQTIENREQLDEIKAYLKVHSIQSTTSDKLSRLLRSFIILD
ncbi:BLUF domain-containing protein [Dokdonia sp. R78006]|uniref:BLUF domain-containing protein n=1 Tax=Dokdonia sp. R78006 TaxID=3093866 RepID=UPI0036D2EF6E